MNLYTAVNADGELAHEGRLVLAWHHRANARTESKAQAGRWSVITIGSRRYHRAVATTYGADAPEPKKQLQDDA